MTTDLRWGDGRKDPRAATMALLKRAFSFRGRTSRRGLIEAFLWVWVAALVPALPFELVTGKSALGLDTPPDSWLVAFQPIYIAWALFVSIPWFAAVVRRLHDVGRSGWGILVVLFPYIGILWLIGYLFWPGTKGANAYGEDPRWVPLEQ